jgi:hypothetical protein
VANFALTFDAPINSPKESGFFHRYDSLGIARTLNPVPDGVSQEALWYDRAAYVIMLKPQQIDNAWLNSPSQVPYIIRLSQFTTNPANLTSTALFEANLAQNPSNPFIHHKPITPAAPLLFTDSPEQAPGITDIESHAGDSGLVTGFPGAFPGVSPSDTKVLCWSSSALPWNMPLYIRWWVPVSHAGHKLIYDFYIGNFCIRCGPTVAEVFKDVSAAQDRTAYVSVARPTLFSNGPLQSTSFFSQIINHSFANQHMGHVRGILWLPYRRNYIYLESSYGQYAVVKANGFQVGNGVQGAQADWGIVQSRNLVVAALTPGPGFFQVQKVKFADGPGKFQLPQFHVDFAPAATPANNWLVDEIDTPEGSTLTHTTPASPVPYTAVANPIDNCEPVASDPASRDQALSFGSTYTLSPGTDPTSGGTLKTYTPMFYGTEARIANVQQAWPVTSLSITDKSIASPSARIKHAEITAEIGRPGQFSAEVEDLGASLASYYFRSDFPLQFADQNGQPGVPANWTVLWSGVANPVETREMRLDTAAPREMRVSGTDFWKWLDEAPMRDNRDWTGVGHITVVQSVLQQAGVSVANWDGPAPGTYVNGVFTMDMAGYDDPLGGLNSGDPTVANGTQDSDSTAPQKPVFRPNQAPPDSYGSYIKRIADVWSGWDYGFHPDGTFFYHPFDYYSASEAVFHQSQAGAAPRYFRASVQYDPIFPNANVVATVAATSGGSLRYSTIYVDFGSLYLKTAPNFVGKEKGLLIALPGWISCAAQNKCARAIFQRARRRRLRVNFHGTYVPGLRIGHGFQLQGISGTWRLQSVRATYERQGWDTAMMTGELIERGYV